MWGRIKVAGETASLTLPNPRAGLCELCGALRQPQAVHLPGVSQTPPSSLKGISTLCSPPVPRRELLTARLVPARRSDAWVPRHHLLIYSTSFARFEIIWVQSTCLTR